MQNNFGGRKKLIYNHLNKIMFSKGIFFLLSNTTLEILKIAYLSQKHVTEGKIFFSLLFSEI